MTPLDVGTFQATFPEFRSTNPVVIANTLARCTRAVSQRVWCEQWNDGVGLLTAHRLKQMSLGTSTAESPPTPEGDDYDLTNYGREFRTLRDSIVGAFVGGGTW